MFQTELCQALTECSSPGAGLISFYDRGPNTLGRHRYDSYDPQAPQHPSEPEEADSREHLRKNE